MTRTYFGTDGVRGPYGGPVINEAFAAQLAQAAVRWLRGAGERRRESSAGGALPDPVAERRGPAGVCNGGGGEREAGGPASSRPQVPLSPYHTRARTRTRMHAHTRTRNPPPSPHHPASPHRPASTHRAAPPPASLRSRAILTKVGGGEGGSGEREAGRAESGSVKWGVS
jgi:hypothetical protein